MTQPTHVSGTIKPLEWDDLPSASLDFPLSYCISGDDEDGWSVNMTYRECSDELEEGPFPSPDAAKAAAQADHEARIAAQIQPAPDAQPVASSQAGELISKSAIEKELWKIVRRREDQCKNGVTDIQRARWIADKLQAESIIHLIRATPAARAEVSLAEADDLLNIAKDSVEILQVAIDNWNEIHPYEPDEVFTDLQSRCRALTEAGE